MENMGYLFAAFTIIWAVVFGYVFSLLSKQKKLRHDLKSLKETIKERQSEQ